MLALKF